MTSRGRGSADHRVFGSPATGGPGCLHACGDYPQMLADQGNTASMSRAGRCYDAAM